MDYKIILVYVIITLLIIVFTIFISNGLINNYPAIKPGKILKQPVFGLNTTECKNSVLSCNTKDIGVYNNFEDIVIDGETLNPGDQFCQNTCKEGKNQKMRCMQKNDYKTLTEEGGLLNNNDFVCVEKGIKDKSHECNFKHGGEYAFTGYGEDSQGWKCFCAWPQYAGGIGCDEINPGVCGSHGENGSGEFNWDASLKIPEDVVCDCKEGYVLMKSLEGKPDICVKEDMESFYKDLYY